jgi:hypothetical protein
MFQIKLKNTYFKIKINLPLKNGYTNNKIRKLGNFILKMDMVKHKFKVTFK